MTIKQGKEIPRYTKASSLNNNINMRKSCSYIVGLFPMVSAHPHLNVETFWADICCSWSGGGWCCNGFPSRITWVALPDNICNSTDTSDIWLYDKSNTCRNHSSMGNSRIWEMQLWLKLHSTNSKDYPTTRKLTFSIGINCYLVWDIADRIKRKIQFRQLRQLR